MRAVVAIAVLALPAVAAAEIKRSAAAVKPKREQACDVLDYGLYVPDTAPVRFPDPTSVTGERFEIEGVSFLKTTKLIPAELGRGFGFRYKLRALPKIKPFSETVRVIYPRPVRGNASWEHKSTEVTADGTLVQHLLYDFIYNYEIVPGEWKFQILVDNQLACSISFQIR